MANSQNKGLEGSLASRIGFFKIKCTHPSDRLLCTWYLGWCIWYLGWYIWYSDEIFRLDFDFAFYFFTFDTKVTVTVFSTAASPVSARQLTREGEKGDMGGGGGQRDGGGMDSLPPYSRPPKVGSPPYIRPRSICQTLLHLHHLVLSLILPNDDEEDL